MPSIKKGESESDYVKRCIPYVIKKEGASAKEAAGKCHGMYKQHKKKGTQYCDFEADVVLLDGEEADKADAQRLGVSLEEYQEKYKPPESGDAPKSVKDILRKSYSNCRKQYPNYSKERCSKISWGAVKNAGWSKDKNGKWHKTSKKENMINEDTFAFKCDTFEFLDSNEKEETYKMTIAIANRFMRRIYISKDELKKAYNNFNGTMHDLNHKGTGYIAGFSVISSDISYFVGYQDSVQYNDSTGELTAVLHIFKDSPRYNEWKNYINICEQIGRVPNVSMYTGGKIEFIQARNLPKDSHYGKNGYKADDLVPCMINIQPLAVSTVFRGACNDTDGCGIKNSCDDGSCDLPSDDVENKERREYLEKIIKRFKK